MYGTGPSPHCPAGPRVGERIKERIKNRGNQQNITDNPNKNEEIGARKEAKLTRLEYDERGRGRGKERRPRRPRPVGEGEAWKGSTPLQRRASPLQLVSVLRTPRAASSRIEAPNYRRHEHCSLGRRGARPGHSLGSQAYAMPGRH